MDASPLSKFLVLCATSNAAIKRINKNVEVVVYVQFHVQIVVGV